MLWTFSVPLLNVNNIEESKKLFGAWLQSEREKAGITQDQVAKKTGLNVKSISRIERGESGTRRDTLIAIVESVNALSHGYQINLNTALQRCGYAPNGADDGDLIADGLFSGYYDLDEDQKRLARKQIAALLRSFKTE
jgi:transcriptional regulator with XRE-family HTH domain